MAFALTSEQRTQLQKLYPFDSDGQPGIRARILAAAIRGTEAPDTLTLQEIVDMSFAIIVHYALSDENLSSPTGYLPQN